MTIDLTPASRLLDSRSWPEARALALAALAETPRRAEALRLLATVSEAEGRLDDADRFLSDAVAVAPEDAASIDELIRLSHLRGDLRRLGEALLARLRISPGVPALWNDLGAVLERLDDRRQAATGYRRAVAVDPTHAPAIRNAAALAFRLAQFPEALRFARRGIALEADAGQMLVVGGHAQQRLGDAAKAARSYRRALALVPSEVPAWEGLAAARREAKADDESLRHILRTIALAPFSPVALANLCEALRTAKDPNLALRYGRRALALAPDLVVAANALSLTLGSLFGDHRSTDWAKRALHMNPGDAELMINLGIALKSQGLFAQAQQHLRRGLERRPNDANAHMALATALLASGGLKEGFAEYEWRHVPAFYGALPAPCWDGRPVVDGALLLRGEQGIGDEIMFMQYIRDLHGRAGRIVAECDKRLMPVFRRSFPGTEFVARTTPPDGRLTRPDIAAQIALLSLPHVLGLGIAELRSKGPYLIPDDSRRPRMAARLAALGPGLRVGVSWRSLRRTHVTARMHTELVEWAPILRTPGVSFINLQYGDVGAELDLVRRELGAGITHFADLDLFNDMEGALALGSCLDLVISTVTTAYCLATAAGIETWHLHNEVDYLGFGEERYVFCPRSRSFMRRAGESWAGPIAGIAEALRSRVASAGGRSGK